MRVFPLWAEHLGLGDVAMSGHDLPIHAEPERYRELVARAEGRPARRRRPRDDAQDRPLRGVPRPLRLRRPVRGAAAARPRRSRSADGAFRAHAKDPISSGRSLDEFVPQGYWRRDGRRGAALRRRRLEPRDHAPPAAGAPAATTGRRGSSSSTAARGGSSRCAPCTSGSARTSRSSTSTTPTRVENDRLLAASHAGSLVVNGTGMGKDSPGSPITDARRVPRAARSSGS